jgi:hypothetical protein
MVMVYVDEAAERVLAALYESEPMTVERIEALLDVLEEDPGDPRVRRRSVRASAGASANVAGPVWGFTVRGRDTDYLVLWQPAADDDAAVDVRYIGADVF